MPEVQNVLPLFLCIEGDRVCFAPIMDFALTLPQTRKDEIVAHATSERPKANEVIRVHGFCEKGSLHSKLYVFVIDAPKNWTPDSTLKKHVDQLERARFRSVHDHVINASTKPAADYIVD